MAKGYIPKISFDTVWDTPRCILRDPKQTDAPRLLSAFTSDLYPGDLPLGQIQSLDEVHEWLIGFILSVGARDTKPQLQDDF